MPDPLNPDPPDEPTGGAPTDKDNPRPRSSNLLPAVYAELRRLARSRMSRAAAGNTLQPTALVHEAYLRLSGGDDKTWNGQGHFFAAAAQAMRQILIEQARRKAAVKHGGDQKRVDSDDFDIPIEAPTENLLALDMALDKLQEEDPRKAEIVLLRYFAGLNREETAAALDISVRTIDREWRYIVARLHKEMSNYQSEEEPSDS